MKNKSKSKDFLKNDTKRLRKELNKKDKSWHESPWIKLILDSIEGKRPNITVKIVK